MLKATTATAFNTISRLVIDRAFLATSVSRASIALLTGRSKGGHL